MKKPVVGGVIGVVVVLAVAGGGYLYAQHRAAEALTQGIEAFRATLPPGSTFTYATAEPSLLSRSAHLTGVALGLPGERHFTAASADVTPGPDGTVGHLDLRGLASTNPQAKGTADSLVADQLFLPRGANPGDVDPAAIRVGHGELSGVRVQPSQGGSVALATLALDGYGTGQAGSVHMAGLDAQLPDMDVDHVQLASGALTGFMLADTVARLRSGNGAWPQPKGATGIDLSGLAVGVHGKPLVSLASATSHGTPATAGKGDGALDMTGLAVQADPQLTPALGELGYARFLGDVHLHATADASTHQFRMDRLDLDAPDMGHLHTALGLDNVPDTLLKPTGSGNLGTLSSGFLLIQLQSATVRYEDASLVPKLFALAGKSGAGTADAAKGAAKQQVLGLAAEVNLPPAVTDPVLAFLDDPHRLVVTVAPPQPVPLGNLPATAADPQHSLGLTVAN